MTAAPPRRSTGVRRLILLSTALLLGMAGEARACSCVGAADGFPTAEGAFVGTIVAKAGALDRVAYTFEVEKVYKGSYPRRVTFPSTLAEPSCGMDREPGFRTGVVIFGDEQRVGICNLISEDELEDLATPRPPAPGAGRVPSLLGALLGACWARWT